jgi:hypothetical protein
MDRVIATNSVAVPGDVAPVSGTPQSFTSGNPATSTPATVLPAYQMNALQEEIRNAIVGGGLTPDRTNNAQLWAAIQGLVAGSSRSSGFVNKFYNATAAVAKRGTTGSAAAGAPVYTLDGHMVGATGAAVTWAQVAGIGRAPFGLKLTGQVGVTDALWKQRIESIEAAGLAGQVVTVQAKIANASGASITPTLTVKRPTVSDNYGATATDVNAVALQACPNSATTTVSYSFTANAAAVNGLEVTLDFGGGLNGAGKNLTIGDFDIRADAAVQAPELRAFSMEWLQCQRYLPGFVGASLANVASGMMTSATTGISVFPFVTAARIAPNGLLAGTGYSLMAANGTSSTGGSPTFNSAGLYSAAINHNGFAGFVAGNATIINSPLGSFLFTGAEL